MALPVIIARVAQAAARAATKARTVIKTATQGRKAAQASTATQRIEQAKAFEKQRISQAKAKVQRAKEPMATRSEAARSNKVFQREIANASQGRPSALGRNARRKVQVFYRSTQRIWEGVPASQRNQAIMDYFNTDNLYQAYLKTMARNTKALREAEAADLPLTDTEQDAFYNEVEPLDETDNTPITTYIF